MSTPTVFPDRFMVRDPIQEGWNGDKTESGHNEWQTREKATEELKALGFQAQSLLREALKTNADPEVRRRIERILSAIQ
jgi:hypothetical protein